MKKRPGWPIFLKNWSPFGEIDPTQEREREQKTLSL